MITGDNMIYTVTLNPSIDYTVRLENFTAGITNRTSGEEYSIGGKGINVSLILSELGVKSKALGFVAGFTGKAIEEELAAKGIETDLIRLKSGFSRINVKIFSDLESEINGQGPCISDEEFEMFLRKIEKLSDGDTIIIAGSAPKIPVGDPYGKILERLKGRNVRIIVDTSKEQLLNSLKYEPFLIKPNKQELSEIFGAEIGDDADIEKYVSKLKRMGAKNVIVSLGSGGALMFDSAGNKYRSGVLKEKVLGTVGAGDSMVAGFAAGYEKTGDISYAFTLGTACGNATAFSAGLATKEKINNIIPQIRVEAG